MTAHADTFVRDRLPPREQWPEFLFTRPELQYPARLNAAAALIDGAVARGWGDRPAIHTGFGHDRATVTYSELLARANQVAHVLRSDLGLVTGTRVLLRGPNNPMFAACWLAVLKAGCIAVPTMPLLRARELTKIVKKAKVGAALCDHRLAEELAKARFECPSLSQVLYLGDHVPGSLDDRLARHPETFATVDTAVDDPAFLAFTSGTTGQPKGTVHFHRDVLVACDTFSRHVVRPTDADVFCGSPPLAFTYGLGGLLAFPLHVGASTVLQEQLTPETLLQTIQEHRATICFTAPTVYRRVVDHVGAYDISSLRTCVSAGETLPAATRQRFRETTGIEIIDGIGSTELTHCFVSHLPEDARPGATGYAVPGYEAAVIDDEGRRCPPGVVGRLAVRGPTGCLYLDDDRQTHYVLPDGPMKGWNVTGDAYVLDEDGYFHYQARTDDMIISAGYNIAGPEVEGALLTHAAVAECGVIGVPDEARGHIVKAFVVLKSGVAPSDDLVRALQDHVKEEIAPFKYPRAIEFVDTLPRTETGKLQRFKLRQPADGPAVS